MFSSPTNLYYILVKLEHSNFIIFFNIVDIVFLTPLQLHFRPIFDLSDVLQLNYYFKSVNILLFSSLTNLYYILVKLEHSNCIILTAIDAIVHIYHNFGPNLRLTSMKIKIPHAPRYKSDLKWANGHGWSCYEQET